MKITEKNLVYRLPYSQCITQDSNVMTNRVFLVLVRTFDLDLERQFNPDQYNFGILPKLMSKKYETIGAIVVDVTSIFIIRPKTPWGIIHCIGNRFHNITLLVLKWNIHVIWDSRCLVGKYKSYWSMSGGISLQYLYYAT